MPVRRRNCIETKARAEDGVALTFNSNGFHGVAVQDEEMHNGKPLDAVCDISS